MNTNGDVSFDKEYTSYASGSFPLSGNDKLIAIFWTDIDTTRLGNIYYRISLDNNTLQDGTALILSSFPNIKYFSASWMMVVTWEKVVVFNCAATESNINCNQVRFEFL